jgi:hypothetical protein
MIVSSADLSTSPLYHQGLQFFNHLSITTSYLPSLGSFPVVRDKVVPVKRQLRVRDHSE